MGQVVSLPTTGTADVAELGERTTESEVGSRRSAAGPELSGTSREPRALMTAPASGE